MTVRAKTLVKDKFWIVEQNGEKLGTLQKQNTHWVYLNKAEKETQVYPTSESLIKKFGVDIFATGDNPIIEDEVQADNFDVHGFYERFDY